MSRFEILVWLFSGVFLGTLSSRVMFYFHFPPLCFFFPTTVFDRPAQSHLSLISLPFLRILVFTPLFVSLSVSVLTSVLCFFLICSPVMFFTRCILLCLVCWFGFWMFCICLGPVFFPFLLLFLFHFLKPESGAMVWFQLNFDCSLPGISSYSHFSPEFSSHSTTCVPPACDGSTMKLSPRCFLRGWITSVFLSSSVWQTWAERKGAYILFWALFRTTGDHIRTISSVLFSNPNRLVNKHYTDWIRGSRLQHFLWFEPQGWGISCACISSPIWFFMRLIRGT